MSSLNGQFNKAEGHTQIGLLYHLSLGAITPTLRQVSSFLSHGNLSETNLLNPFRLMLFSNTTLPNLDASTRYLFDARGCCTSDSPVVQGVKTHYLVWLRKVLGLWVFRDQDYTLRAPSKVIKLSWDISNLYLSSMTWGVVAQSLEPSSHV